MSTLDIFEGGASITSGPSFGFGLRLGDFLERHDPENFRSVTISGETPGVFAKGEAIDGRLVCGWRTVDGRKIRLPILSPLQDTYGLTLALWQLEARGSLWSPEGDFICHRLAQLAWDTSEPACPCYWLLRGDAVEALLRAGNLELALPG